MILSSLFSVTLLFGGVAHTVFADESLPNNPTTAPSGEVTPPETGDSATPNDPVTPPETGDSGTDGSDTGTVTPPPSETVDSGTTPPSETVDSGTGGSDTGTTVPSETETSGSSESDTGTTTPLETKPSEEENNKPETPATTEKEPGEKTKESTPPTTNVQVNPDGTIDQTGSAGKTTTGFTVPIQTNNVKELTHIPTVSTPVEAETGEKIVSVIDGVAYKQTDEGLTPVSAKVVTLPSGNVAVKGSDGQLKVLPKTGSEQTLLLTVLGSLLTLGTGVVWWKKRI